MHARELMTVWINHRPEHRFAHVAALDHGQSKSAKIATALTLLGAWTVFVMLLLFPEMSPLVLMGLVFHMRKSKKG